MREGLQGIILTVQMMFHAYSILFSHKLFILISYIFCRSINLTTKENYTQNGYLPDMGHIRLENNFCRIEKTFQDDKTIWTEN